MFVQFFGGNALKSYATTISLSDKNECEENNGGCSHGCENTIGGFQCTCPRGHYLVSHDKICTGNIFKANIYFKDLKFTIALFVCIVVFRH